MAHRRPAKLAWITLDPGPPLDIQGSRLLHGDRRDPGKLQSSPVRSPSVRCRSGTGAEHAEGACLTRISILSRPQSAPPKLSCLACEQKRYLQQQDSELTSLRLSYKSRRPKTADSHSVQSKHSFLTGAVYNSNQWLDVNHMDKSWIKDRPVARSRDRDMKSKLPTLAHRPGNSSASHKGRCYVDSLHSGWTTWDNQGHRTWTSQVVGQRVCVVQGSTLTLSSRSPGATRYSARSQSSAEDERQQLVPPHELQREETSQQTRSHRLLMMEGNEHITSEVSRSEVPTAEKLVTTAFEFQSPEAQGRGEENASDEQVGDDNYMRVEITDVSHSGD